MSEPTDAPIEDHQPATAEEHAQPSVADAPHLVERKSLTYPVALLLFASALLLGILIAMALRPKPSGGLSPDDPAIAIAKADLDARRSELNRQRTALGLAPIGGSTSTESIEDVASRVKKDVGTLTEISGRFQQLIAESDSMATEKGKELLASEKARQELSHDNLRLTEERDKALSASASADLLRSQLDLANKELANLREQVASTANRPTEASFETTRRQLEEANRAKSFFETRAKELEAKLAGANPDDMTKLRDEVARLQAELLQLRSHKQTDPLVPAPTGGGTDPGAQ